MADYEKSSKALSAKELVSILLVIAVLLAGAVPIYKTINKHAAEMNCKKNLEVAIETLEKVLVDYKVDDYSWGGEYPVKSENGGTINWVYLGLNGNQISEIISSLNESDVYPADGEEWTINVTPDENGDYHAEVVCNDPEHIIEE